MKKTILILCYLVFAFLQTAQILTAQDESINHQKYWYYKSRLNNDFIKVGNTATGSTYSNFDGHGESIPFNERHSKRGIPGVSGLGSNNDIKNGVDMDQGDSPTRLGIYLSVLVTEYKLLKANNQDLTRVKHEIFCALNAINRLDYHAEPALDASKSPNLNGFFIRSDIPRLFIKDHYTHFNFFNYGEQDSLHDRGFTQTFNGRVIRGNAKFPDIVLSEQEPSQDHYYYLLMGLTLANKLIDASDVDGSNVFGYGSGETSLSVEAGKIALRLISHISSTPNWIIKNPNTNSIISGYGGSASAYAYALDNLGCYIKHEQSLPYVYISVPLTPGGFPMAASNDFRNTFSKSPQCAIAYNLMATGLGNGGFSVDQAGFFHCLAGIGDNVYENQIFMNTAVQAAISALQTIINGYLAFINVTIQSYLNNLPLYTPQWLLNAVQTAISILQASALTAITAFNSSIAAMTPYLMPSVMVNTTDARLWINSNSGPVTYNNNCTGPSTPLIHTGSQLYFGTYVRDLLHGYDQSLPTNYAWLTTSPAFSHNLIKNTVESILNTAPCEGNYHYGTSVAYPYGSHWGASCFIDRIDRVWNKAVCPEWRGDFSGLDYLLLHNLYYLVEGTNSSIDFSDHIDRTVTTNYPDGSNFSSSNSSAMVKGAFEYVRPANAIASNGKVIFRAGKEIIPVPGAFSVAQGAEVGFDTTPYLCSGLNDDSMNRSAATTGENINDPKKRYIKPETKQEIKKDKSAAQFQALLNKHLDSLQNKLKDVSAIIGEYNKISIYPNPNAGNFVIDLKLDREDNVDIQIIDMIGNIVFTQNYVTGTFSLPVNLNTIAKGVYVAKITFSTGKEEIRKISIQ